jgi:hypothetical protein
MTAAPKFAARLPPPEIASAKNRPSLLSWSVKFHEPAVSGGASLEVHSLFQPGRQLPGRMAHPPTTSRSPIMQTLAGDVLLKHIVKEGSVLKNPQMNERVEPDVMEASQRGRL